MTGAQSLKMPYGELCKNLDFCSSYGCPPETNLWLIDLSYGSLGIPFKLGQFGHIINVP